MKRILVSEYLPDEHVARLAEQHDVVYDPDLWSDRPTLLNQGTETVAILVRNRTRIDQELLSAAPQLQVVGRMGVGLDNIDMPACAAAGVTVIPAIGANSVSVAEYVMTTMLVLVRQVVTMTESIVAGDWPPRPRAYGRELMGKTLGLVGYGTIARYVAARASAFGMTILAYDPYVDEHDPAWDRAERSELPRLLTEADIVSLHTPLTPDTRNLINAAAFERMKPTAILINTSRSEVVDEDALLDALREGVIGGAAIDVFPTEPLPREEAAKYAGLDNLILTPHLAGNTAESVDRVARMTVDAVLAQLED